MPKTVLIEPQHPYMYVPRYDYAGFVRAAVRVFKDIRCRQEYCYFEKRCSDVDQSKDLRVQVFSLNPRVIYNFKFSSDRMLIPGSEVGDSDDKCYLAVFGQDEAKQDAWYIGNVILSDYYVVFDMENYALTENNDAPESIQIGIAKKNPAGITYEKHPDGWYNEDGVHNGWTAKKETRTDFKAKTSSSGGVIAAVVIILLCLCGGAAGFIIYKRR